MSILACLQILALQYNQILNREDTAKVWDLGKFEAEGPEKCGTKTNDETLNPNL